MFENLPLTVPFKENLTLRGEAVISYNDFEKINAEITDEGAKYKNPRNLCSGSVRQLNNEITAQRHVRFYAFNLVSAEGMEFDLRSQQMEWLKTQGFEVVESKQVNRENIRETVGWFADKIDKNEVSKKSENKSENENN